MKFYYLDGTKAKYLTLKRGASEWANQDCPAIYIKGDPTRWPGWILMNQGLILEDGNADLFPLVREFVRKSGEAFHRKYPDSCHEGQGHNGFLNTFDAETRRYHPKLMEGIPK